MVLAACGGGSDSAETTTAPPTTAEEGETIQGSLLIIGGSTGDITDCEGDGGFSDIGPGTAVTVRDGSGEIVGTGDLESHPSEEAAVDRVTLDSVAAGTAEDEAEVRELVETSGGFLCPLFYDVDVSDAEFYELEIGNRDITVSRDELEGQDWRMSSTLNGL